VELIKRHSEKVILLGVLLFVILTMSFAISAINETHEISDRKLDLKPMSVDYQQQDPNHSKFQVDEQVQKSLIYWQASGVRNAATCSNHSSDLVIFPGIAKCPLCGKMIPGYYFSGKECPECGQVLPEPERPKNGRYERTEADQDADGIPDEWEVRYNLNQIDPAHALFDDDGDGFSNLYEYTCKTKPNVPRDHPPLWHRIVFTNVHLKRLPANLKTLTFNSTTGAWKAQVELDGKGTQFWYVDKTYSIGRRSFKVTAMDEATVTLQEVKGDNPETITMHVGQPTFSSDKLAVLEDIADPAFKIEVRPGDKFTVGNDVVGREEYRVQSFDGEKKEVVLEALSPNAQDKTVTVGSESKIPADMRVQSGIAEESVPPSAEPNSKINEKRMKK